MILTISENKKNYLPLLLLADEQEDMIDRYLESGTLFVEIVDDEPICVCVVTREESFCEIKNLATAPAHQKKGHARRMIAHVERNFCSDGETLTVGTGDSPLTIPFYEKCGFACTGILPNFFTDNYDHEIWEDGVLLRDMILLSKTVRHECAPLC